MAKSNTIRVFAALVLLELLLLAFSRVLHMYVPPIYNTVPLSLTIVFKLTIIILFVFMAICLVMEIPSIKGKRISPFLFKALVIAAAVLNLVSFIFVADAARYTSGSLSGLAGVIYVGADGLNLLVFLLVISTSLSDSSSRILTSSFVLVFLVSYVINIDGLAKALTLLSVLLVCIRPRFGFNSKLLLLVLIGVFVGWYGLLRKIPDYDITTISTLSSWVVYRFSINIESMLIFLSGQSIMADHVSAIAICLDSFASRFQFIFDQVSSDIEFKSVSQAIYYDLYNSMDGGSSPGFLYGSFLIAGYFGFMFVMIFGYLLKTYLSRSKEGLGVFAILGMLLLFRSITTDIPDALVILSPSFINIAIFVLVCFVSGPSMRQKGEATA